LFHFYKVPREVKIMNTERIVAVRGWKEGAMEVV
jgi:hypothetical protein